jgi:hypothetical protein
MCAIGLSAVPAAATYRASGFVLWHIAGQSLRGGLSAAGESRHCVPSATVGSCAAQNPAPHRYPRLRALRYRTNFTRRSRIASA